MMENNVTVVAPVKTIAVVLSVVAVVWLIVSIAGEGWVIVRFLYFEDQTWTWGLWNTCNKLEEAFTVCIKEDWITVCLVFSIMALILSLAATVCGLLGIKDSKESGTKTNIFYKVAAGFLSVVALLEFMVVIIFPVKFGHDIMYAEAIRRWDFDWAYGFAWGGLIFSIGATVFFVMPIRCPSSKSREANRNKSKEYISREP